MRNVFPFLRQISRIAVWYRRHWRFSRCTTVSTANKNSHWKPAKASKTVFPADNPRGTMSNWQSAMIWCRFSLSIVYFLSRPLMIFRYRRHCLRTYFGALTVFWQRPVHIPHPLSVPHQYQLFLTPFLFACTSPYRRFVCQGYSYIPPCAKNAIQGIYGGFCAMSAAVFVIAADSLLGIFHDFWQIIFALHSCCVSESSCKVFKCFARLLKRNGNGVITPAIK